MRHSTELRRLAGALLASAAVMAAPGVALAQADGSEGGLAEIIVTAQKREQNVQDTPLAVNVIAGDALTTAGIGEVRELSRMDSTLQIGQSTGVLTTFIRGIGNPVTTAGNEASVPIYIDDVYFVRASAPFFELASVDRVEILKGPQGTLFGRNASGGVISIYTRDPSMDAMQLEVRGGYSNYKTADAKGYLNLPLADSVAANLSVSYHNQADGWGRNKQLVDPLDTSKGFKPGGRDYFKGKSLSLRGKILAELTDSTTVKLIGYYQNSRSNIGLYSRPFPGTRGGTPDGAHNGFANVPGMFPQPSQYMPKLGFYDVSLPEGKEQYVDSEGYGFSARIDQELGFADLVSITAYRKNDEINTANGNYSPYPWAFYDLNLVDKQFSQELQLKSSAGSKVDWILGAYYLNADGGFGPTKIHGPAVEGFGLESIKLFGQQKVKSYAVFSQVTYPLGDSTRITGGIRYTKDKVIGKGCTQITLLPNTPLPCTDDTVNVSDISPSFSKVTWKGAIDHKINEDAMVYASVSRGYKAGTFNTLPLNSEVLKPEVVDAYEIGLKSEMWDRKVRFNVALFWNDIKNPQVQAQLNGLVFLKNAGSARTKGIEMDVAVAAAEGLTLRLGGSYLDAKFRNFPDAPAYATYEQCQNPTSPAMATGCAGPAPSPGNLNTYTVDASGNRLPYASKFKLTASANYETQLGNAGTVNFDLNGNYSSKFNWDADNVHKEPAHFLVDASLGFTPSKLDNLTVRLWAKNLTNRKYNINYYAQASGSAFSSAPGAPRLYGVELAVKY